MQENPLKIFFPGKLVFGNGTLNQLADDVLQLKPSRVFIATIVPLKEAIADFVATLEHETDFGFIGYFHFAGTFFQRF